MPAKSNDSPETPLWDKEEFDRFYCSLSRSRCRSDEARLDEIINHAYQNSPTFVVLYDWAIEHEIDFFIDHRVRRAGAYYQQGTGAVGLGQFSDKTLPVSAGFLGHEIRHAWQDFYGLLNYSDEEKNSLGKNMMRNAVYEADAFAFGATVETEIRQSAPTLECLRPYTGGYWGNDYFIPPKHNWWRVGPHLEGDELLLHFFKEWFARPEKTTYYGRRKIAAFGGRGGYNEPQDDYEFSPVDKPGTPNEKTLTRFEDILRYGDTIDGSNYLRALDKEFVYKNILSPSRAFNLYGGATKQDRSAIEGVRKKALLEKLPKDKIRRKFKFGGHDFILPNSWMLG